MEVVYELQSMQELNSCSFMKELSKQQQNQTCTRNAKHNSVEGDYFGCVIEVLQFDVFAFNGKVDENWIVFDELLIEDKVSHGIFALDGGVKGTSGSQFSI